MSVRLTIVNVGIRLNIPIVATINEAYSILLDRLNFVDIRFLVWVPYDRVILECWMN